MTGSQFPRHQPRSHAIRDETSRSSGIARNLPPRAARRAKHETVTRIVIFDDHAGQGPGIWNI
jgi:hypothetical protein